MSLNTFARRTAPIWSMLSSIFTLAGIVGAGWAIWQYNIQKEADRQKYTLELVAFWQEEGYRKSYDDLASNVLLFMQDVPGAQLEAAAKNPDLKIRLQENFARRVDADPANIGRVRDVVYFFKWLDICLKKSICSQDTTAAFFDDTVHTFLDNYGVYINKRSVSLPAGLDLLEGLSKALNVNNAPYRE
ncbi:hypothetical protein [Rhizobium sp. 18065]|uniref:hypothetical protein n=1 Tax=Rhizobium sp. 18065 TaxID=2681411 RepID=UPI00135B8B1B|nr:hypothetical protein [Rhizobium sp. 18065]